LNITILLQGYSSSSNQLLDDVNYYRSLNYNVVVSSYSECTSLLDQSIVVNNDISEGVDVEDSMQPNNLGVNKDKTYKVKASHKFFTQSGFNLNFQIHTTKSGLNKIKQIYPDTDYILKLRADMKLVDLDKYVPNWIESKKITVKGPPGSSGNKEWKVFDFWTFGSYIDIINYYSIPYATTYYSPESYLTQYIKNTHNVSWEEAKIKYFNFEYDIPTFWYKYNGWLDTSMETGFTGIYPKHITNDRPN